jgi:hypothetical protein
MRLPAIQPAAQAKGGHTNGRVLRFGSRLVTPVKVVKDRGQEVVSRAASYARHGVHMLLVDSPVRGEASLLVSACALTGAGWAIGGSRCCAVLSLLMLLHG